MKKWCFMVCMALLLFLTACSGKVENESPVMPENPNENVQCYLEKAALLRENMVIEDIIWELGDNPAGEAGHVVFFSVCDGTQRANVYHGTGSDLSTAWDAAQTATAVALQKNALEPLWVKADVVYLSESISMEDLNTDLSSVRSEFFRYGTAFDTAFQTALLEAELNGAKIYGYEDGCMDLDYLNLYLDQTEQNTMQQLPKQVTVFRTFGWFCDENYELYQLKTNDLDFGRRQVDLVDRDYVGELIISASDFLVEQIQEDGSFIYGYYPRFDNEIENYNIVRHASTIWSLLCRYRMEPNETLKENIDQTIHYMLTQVIMQDDATAYLWEAKDDEIKLGGCGLAVVVLTEYMDVFQTNQYEAVCRQLGNGILQLFDASTGEYTHVLNGDFSLKETFRTIYYDGEATFALCRLYGLTGESQWLMAAQTAIDHWIDADYTQYRDHWVAYTLNEFTKYVNDDEAYFQFALRNAQNNLEEIAQRDTTYHTYLELLMATFELYDRMISSGAEVEGFYEQDFLQTIYTRAEHMLNGYFYPEYAMYMENPQKILGAFMVRHDGYRVRIDDVQHNIGGYYLYYKNYDRLVAYGMLEAIVS